MDGSNIMKKVNILSLPKGDARLPIIINHEGCDPCDMIDVPNPPRK